MRKDIATVDSISFDKGTRERYSEHPVLTKKEMETLVFLAQGLTDQEIADHSVITNKVTRYAIKHRIRVLLKKFGAANRMELMACAFRSGILR